MNKDFFKKQLSELISNFRTMKNRSANYDLSGNNSTEEIVSLLSRCKSAVQRISGINSEYYKDINSIMRKNNIWEGEKLIEVIGCVDALFRDLENGYLQNLSEIIKSEVFSDYIEMAEHLLEEGYKDPATVLIGSTLENKLKELCTINSIDLVIINNRGNTVYKKAEVLNAELCKSDIYSLATQKQITAWLNLRNYAAHGEYNKYTSDEIKLFIAGVRHFLLSY